MVIDTDQITEIIRETAALDVLPRFQNLAESEIMEKSPGDIVTVADHDAEIRLTKALGDIMPGADTLAGYFEHVFNPYQPSDELPSKVARVAG